MSKTAWFHSQDEMRRLYNNKTAIVYDYKTVYQIYYSQAQEKYYAQPIKKILGRNSTPYTLRGRIQAVSSDTLV